MAPQEAAPSTDPLGRAGAIAIAAARIGIGLGAMLAPRRALPQIGLGSAEGSVTLARMAGVRDVALGLHGLAVRDDPDQLRHAVHLAALADAGDAAAFAALAARNGIGRAFLVNFPAAAGAVVAGAWVSSRLRS